jgi:hypothetical protein
MQRGTEIIDKRLGNRTGQQRRQDDWLVGQYIRTTNPREYRCIRTKAMEAELQKLKDKFGTVESPSEINTN